MVKFKYWYDSIGATCEHCGRGIKHVYLVENENNSLKLGSTCIIKAAQLINEDKKSFTALTNKLGKLYKEYNDLESKLTEEERNEFYSNWYGKDNRFNKLLNINTLEFEEANKELMLNIGSFKKWTVLNQIYSVTKEINETFNNINLKLK